MGKWSWERLAAATGLVFIALLIVSAAIFSPPSATKPAPKITAYFLHHHRAGIVSGVLSGVAIIFFLWAMGSLAAALRNGGEPRLAMIALGGAVATAATAAVGNAISTAITYRIALDSPAVVKSVYDIDVVLFTMIGFTIAIISGATAIAAWRARIFPQWYGALSALATLVFVSGGAALTFKGFYSPTGAWSFVSFIVFLVWVFLTTVLLLMRAEAEAVPTGRTVTT